jgi:hypothetical protein
MRKFWLTLLSFTLTWSFFRLSGSMQPTSQPLSTERGRSTSTVSPVEVAAFQVQEPQSLYETFFPFINASDTGYFNQNFPIWAHSNPPAPHEVALFRQNVELKESLEAAKLQIFADPRYEVWIDGKFIGRGPARFAAGLREYDVYDLGKLPTGMHTIAVLAQWAPSYRRSESILPYLRATVYGTLPSGPTVVMTTNTQWKVHLSPAWRQDAAPVHAWNLIGPTELLDLRLLPADWQQPSFDDSGWGTAVLRDSAAISESPLWFADQAWHVTPRDEQQVSQNSEEVLYRRRSIPFLRTVPFTPVVVDAGWLSPDYRIGEIPAAPAGLQTVSFENPSATRLVIETLARPASV